MPILSCEEGNDYEFHPIFCHVPYLYVALCESWNNRHQRINRNYSRYSYWGRSDFMEM